MLFEDRKRLAIAGAILLVTGLIIYSGVSRIYRFAKDFRTLSKTTTRTSDFESLRSELDAVKIKLGRVAAHVQRESKRTLGLSDEIPVAPMPFGGIHPGYKKQVSCDAERSGRTLVIVALGQSNAANFVSERFTQKYGERILNVFGTYCYIAEDPLMGSSGNMGSVWTPLAEALIEAGVADRVYLAPVALGGSSMDRWGVDGDLPNAAEFALRQLKRIGLKPTIVTFTQGEAEVYPDNPYRRDSAPYVAGLQQLIDLALRFGAEKFLVATTSTCQDTNDQALHAPEIRRAQLSVLDEKKGVLAGADLDAVNAPGDRYDVCHLTEQGAKKIVADWLSRIKAVQPAKRAPER